MIFALPTLLHEDERYYAKGEGGIFKRGIYAATRVLITPNYKGHNTLNISELLGRASAQAISVSYYPEPGPHRQFDRDEIRVCHRPGCSHQYFSRVWQDIATHILHRHP